MGERVTAPVRTAVRQLGDRNGYIGLFFFFCYCWFLCCFSFFPPFFPLLKNGTQQFGLVHGYWLCNVECPARYTNDPIISVVLLPASFSLSPAVNTRKQSSLSCHSDWPVHFLTMNVSENTFSPPLTVLTLETSENLSIFGHIQYSLLCEFVVC